MKDVEIDDNSNNSEEEEKEENIERVYLSEKTDHENDENAIDFRWSDIRGES